MYLISEYRTDSHQAIKMAVGSALKEQVQQVFYLANKQSALGANFTDTEF
ncbi:MAG: hypothetical protein L3J59_13840 [Methylococcaceae bacterium]|nr:hypothetical protein [Methylococcaceae bacterium]